MTVTAKATNKPFLRNARSFSESDRLLERALRTVPLGSQTFSKSHQQYVRGAMPQFMTRGQGCRVEDVDGNSYIDYVLGLLPIVLGYRDPDVDQAIVAQLQFGITFSLPTALEADLAERLVRLIPCAKKVRFGKNGSDATSAAIRLARAHTGRDHVLACGYHGWHDWYIGATSRRLGIPQAVCELTTTFPYNQPEAVADLLSAQPDAYAAVILEPAGVTLPAPGFLQHLRELTERYGVVLVFDEIITGFRINMGGAQAEFGVTPDLACFGKSMANGMPISAIVGRDDIMKQMPEIFFSGTFGGETLSLAASIATIDKLIAQKAIVRMRAHGAHLIERINRLVETHGLASVMKLGGSDWWPVWKLLDSSVEPNLLHSLLRQELAANGILGHATFNLCLAHLDAAVEAETLAGVDASLGALAAALNSADPKSHLRGPMIQPTFRVRST
jgi:glutamate-1-semialdehyde 2,1-aminomutase